MSHRTGRKSAAISLCLMLVCVGAAAFVRGPPRPATTRWCCARKQRVQRFTTATNTTSASNPGGIFSFENYCGPAPIRRETTPSCGSRRTRAAATPATPPTGACRGRSGLGLDLGRRRLHPRAQRLQRRLAGPLLARRLGRQHEQRPGAGLRGRQRRLGGICWATTSTFASHLWPFGGYSAYRRFVFELTCYREAGCDRTNFNAVDANTMELTLNDVRTRRRPDGIGDRQRGMGAGHPARRLERIRPGVGDALLAAASSTARPSAD